MDETTYIEETPQPDKWVLLDESGKVVQQQPNEQDGFLPADEQVSIGWMWDGETFTEPPPVAPAVAVPVSITMRQARLQLHAIDKLAAVQESISQLSEPLKTSAQIEWDYASVVERNSQFVLMLGSAIGLTDVEMDALFIEAAKL